MGGWGRQNPWPFQWGGGQSAFEQTWLSLRGAVGRKNVGAKDTTIEDAWRESRAAGMVPVITMAERAAIQAFPFAATDHLPVFEDSLAVFRRGSDHERRVAVSNAFSSAISALIPDIRTRLQAIDTDLDVLTPDDDDEARFQMGQWLRNFDGHEFGLWGEVHNSSQYPGYSTHYILRLLWQNQDADTGPDPANLALVEQYLDETLPAWADFTIITSQGFLIGRSPLGWTGLVDEPERELGDDITTTDFVSISGSVAYSLKAEITTTDDVDVELL
jgi:hypothetical protein